MHRQNPSNLYDSTTALLWSIAKHRGRDDLHDRIELENLHYALSTLRCRPEIERPAVIDLLADLRELLIGLMDGTFARVSLPCDVREFRTS